jgi:phosphocarrier protein
LTTTHALVAVPNTLGVHLRVAKRFVQVASLFQSDISVSLNGKMANGKSILDLMMLAAGQGERLHIVAKGCDSRTAVAALRSLVESSFGELDESLLRLAIES